MAGENLQQFEALKETGKNTLSGQEKTQLNQVSERDYRQAVSKVESKTFKIDGFKVDGKDPTLKQIVEKLTFSSDGKTAYLNGKAIEPTSELGAAIQVLVIASDFSVGGEKIDGSVGKNTIDGLQKLQNKYRAERAHETETPTPTQPENKEKFWKEGPVELVNDGKYTNLVGIYSNKQYELLGTDGHIKNKIKESDVVRRGGKELVPIKYKSAISNKVESIQVDAKLAYEDNAYGPTKFGQEIEKAIKAKETSLQQQETLNTQNKNITEGINNFSRNSFKDSVIKKYANDMKINFKNATVDKNGTVTYEDGFSNKIWTLNADRRKTLLNSNGTFNSTKFEAIMAATYKNDALNHVKGKLNNSLNEIPTTPITDATTAKNRNKDAGRLITEIDGYGTEHASDFKDIRKKAEKIKTDAENYETYNEALTQLNNDYSTLSGLPGKKLGRSAMLEQGLAIYKKYVKLSNTGHGTYKIVGRADQAFVNKFKEVGKMTEYSNVVDKMSTIMRNPDTFDLKLEK